MLEGIPEGNGILKIAPSGRYEGGFKAGQYHGEGACEFPPILEGARNGKIGAVAVVSGRRYKGSWKKGMMNGQGHLIVGNGDEYRGEFKGNLYHGKGRLVTRNGDIKEGNWQRGLLFSKGNIRLADGTRYEGVLKMGQYCGMGKLTFTGDRGEVDGKFWYGIIHGDQVHEKLNVLSSSLFAMLLLLFKYNLMLVLMTKLTRNHADWHNILRYYVFMQMALLMREVLKMGNRTGMEKCTIR